MQKCAHLVKLQKCRQEEIVSKFFANFRFDTAENEPAKNLQSFVKFANFATPPPCVDLLVGDDALEVAAEPVRDVLLGKVREVLWQQRPQRGPMLLHKPLHVLL